MYIAKAPLTLSIMDVVGGATELIFLMTGVPIPAQRFPAEANVS